jgi:hypothetical protein
VANAFDLNRADAARLRPLIAPPRENERGQREEVVGDDDKEQFLSVRTLRQQYLDYLISKQDEIEEQKEARHYYHSAQYSNDQIRILRLRHQPVLTWNRMARKINSIVGLVERMRSDPKALPRSPKSEQGAEIGTQTVRYVLDANQWKSIDPWCILQASIDGIAGVQLVLTKGDKGDPDIAMPWVIGDEYFYDAKSYRLDFEDNRYEGIAKWLDLDAAIELFPDKEEDLRGLIEGDSDMTTYADREFKWVITSTQRIRLIEHWYKHRGQWCWAFYVKNCLLDQGVSPFYDEKGKTISSFCMFSAAVDHDGDRYGFPRNLKGPQDSLNQGKSKMLHIANSRRVTLEKGAVDNIENARREWARPDGVVEVNPNKQFTPDQTKPDLAAFAQFTEDAKAELDGFANSNIAAMAGTGGVGNLSGRAIELLRQPGMAELGPFILAYRAWKLKIYRAIWNACRKHWTQERWIRVNNDEGSAQFIQLNGLGMNQQGQPAIVNAVGALDVDIILEEGPDVASMMQDTYDALKGYPPGTFPPQVLIELSPLPRSDKNRILQMMAPKPPPQMPPNPMAEIAAKLQLEALAAQNAKVAADTRKAHAGAEQAYATAAEKHAKVGTEAARAGHIAHEAHLDASEFARDSLLEAHKVNMELNAAQQQQNAPPAGTKAAGQSTPAAAAQPAQPQQRPMSMQIPHDHPVMRFKRTSPKDGRDYVPDPQRPGRYAMVG